MSLKKVLLVTPFFAPQSHAAVFRVHKLAKYLPRFGWKPYIVTTDTNYLYNEDPKLLADLPPEVEIHRVRYVEPTLRGLRMALGGKDRSFAAKKDNLIGGIDREYEQPTSIPGRGQRLYSWFLDHWLQVPDPYWTWRRTAKIAALELIEREKIQLVYTTCLPYSCNVIGRDLQRAGCTWVADFRDPGTYSSRMSSSVPRVFEKQERIERETLRSADEVTVLASSYALIFQDAYGAIRQAQYRFIPTGADEEFFPEAGIDSFDKGPFLLHSGEFLPEYGGEFFEVFAQVLENPELKNLGVKLLFVGHSILNKRRVGPLANRLGIASHVEFLDHVPQQNLYELMVRAEACLLLPGTSGLWWTNFAKMVDCIALGAPVLAMVPDPSESRTELRKAGIGVFLDGDRSSSVKIVTDLLLGRLGKFEVDRSRQEVYTAVSQAESFSRVFEGLLAPLSKSRSI